jgi:hypothetical protein
MQHKKKNKHFVQSKVSYNSPAHINQALQSIKLHTRYMLLNTLRLGGKTMKVLL